MTRTEYGSVRGSSADGVSAYLGIPFAAPPVGQLRWRPPVPPKPWQGERKATAFAPACPQVERDSRKAGSNGRRQAGQQQSGKSKVIGSEDCLYLNVWSPASATSNSRLPVMVFIHGGAHTIGSASQERGGDRTYDSELIAKRAGVVVVTLDYRLGALGYLAYPALAKEDPHGSTGGYGTLDSIAALQWVQHNIGNFGGNQHSVLLFGESAGAVETCTLVASPLAAGLFQRALLESGGCTAKTKEQGLAQGQQFVTKIKCDTATDQLGCLRKLKPSTLVTAQQSPTNGINTSASSPGPMVDGYVLTETPLDAIRHGHHNHVPLVVGDNANEERNPGLGIPPGLTAEQYPKMVASVFGPQRAPQVLAQYPLSDFSSPWEAMTQLATDARFLCPARTITRAAMAAQSEPVYRYLFTQGASQGAAARLGADHGRELLYVFQHTQTNHNAHGTPADAALEKVMLGYWTRFAATGDPNGAEGNPVAWPKGDPRSDSYVELGTPVKAGAGVRTAKCDFWDSLQTS